MTQAEDWKRDVCEIFFAQRKVILRTTALIFLGSVAVAFLWPPTYEATSSILLRGKKTQVSPGSLEVTEIRALPIEKEDVSSEIEILNSPRLIEMTVDNIRGKGDSTLDSPPGGGTGFARGMGALEGGQGRGSPGGPGPGRAPGSIATQAGSRTFVQRNQGPLSREQPSGGRERAR